MRNTFFKIPVYALLTGVIILPSLSARTFVSSKGKSIEAKLISSTKTQATLKLLKNGKVFIVPLHQLSENDQEYIAEQREAKESEKASKDAEEKAKITAEEARAKIVEFTKANKGKQVGNGECWTLANEAFKAAGVERSGLRVWGREIDWKKEKVQPGDILELESAVFPKSKTGPNHTAVVVKKGSRRGVLVVYEQNVGDSKRVQKGTYDLRKMKSGVAKVYRYE